MLYAADLHLHSLFCDGKAPARVMAAEGAGAGYVSLGFSAHSPLPWENDWSLPWDRVRDYVETITSFRRRAEGNPRAPQILLGVELDAATMTGAGERRLNLSPFNYIIHSAHTLRSGAFPFAVDSSPAEFAAGLRGAFGGDPAALARAYYDEVAENLRRERSYPAHCVRVVGHLDILTKYNIGERFFREDEGYRRIAADGLRRVLMEDSERALFFEVNTGAVLRSGRPDPYPAPFLLEILARAGARMVIGSDAHTPAQLRAHARGGVHLALRALARAGFRSVYRLRAVRDGETSRAAPEELLLADL